MNTYLLNHMVRLFAVFANIYPSIVIDNIKQYIRLSLKSEYPVQVINEYIELFEENYKNFKNRNDKDLLTKAIDDSVEEINSKTADKIKFLLFIKLQLFEKYILKFSPHQNKSDRNIESLVFNIGKKLGLDEHDLISCKAFIFDRLIDIDNKKNVLVFGNRQVVDVGIQFIGKENLTNQIYFYFVESFQIILFYYKGNDDCKLNNNILFAENIYTFNKGSVISDTNTIFISYNEVLKLFLSDSNPPVTLQTNKLEYTYKNSNNGIHNLSITINSGQLIGIIGRSGTGKSTLINLLNGSLVPNSGNILINGTDLHKNKAKFDGIIGYIPQDDLLVEELTVFENLYLNSKLCLGNLTDEQIRVKVNKLLDDLDLFEIKNLNVGNPINKFISGGQRKRLNIALELIREPWILFADEPTSGLSESDAEEIMQLLTTESIKGKMVIINIHQPSSEIFKLFDQILVLDKEGYSVYFGNPIKSIEYFTQNTGKPIGLKDYCSTCGNINHDTIFKIIEEKTIDKKDHSIKVRKRDPKEWHKLFNETQTTPKENSSEQNALPPIKYSKAAIFKQFAIFFKRNVLSKISNNQYIVLALFVSPVLALILSLLSRHGVDPFGQPTEYVFAYNKNIPSYLFMSVIVALFIGMIVSAEEIFKDRSLLKREKFLGLNKWSYLLSKISLLFLLSLVQTLLFTIIGNSILEINGMFFKFWMILFATSCFANSMGLLISTLFNSVVVIYILVPVFIVPQLLLSGVVVQYDQINRRILSVNEIPIPANLMASRWAYEALMVTQFKDNAYQKHFFNIEKEESNCNYDLIFLIPALNKILEEIPSLEENEKISRVALLTDGLEKLSTTKDYLHEDIASILDKDPVRFNDLASYLYQAKTISGNKLKNLLLEKYKISNNLLYELGNHESFYEFKNKNYNYKVAEIVLNRTDFEYYKIINNRFIRKMEPIYLNVNSGKRNAPFYASDKFFIKKTLGSLSYNLLILWLMTTTTIFFVYLIFSRKNF